jgi:hypothetical protein
MNYSLMLKLCDGKYDYNIKQSLKYEILTMHN